MPYSYDRRASSPTEQAAKNLKKVLEEGLEADKKRKRITQKYVQHMKGILDTAIKSIKRPNPRYTGILQKLLKELPDDGMDSYYSIQNAFKHVFGKYAPDVVDTLMRGLGTAKKLHEDIQKVPRADEDEVKALVSELKFESPHNPEEVAANRELDDLLDRWYYDQITPKDLSIIDKISEIGDRQLSLF